MTWTYTSPGTSDKDWVRFRIGDTDTSDQLLSDEEILSLITEEGSKEAAAAVAAEGLAAEFSRRATSESVGDLRFQYGDQAARYERLADRLRTTFSSRNAAPIAGGISRSRKRLVKDDTDRVPPSFQRDQFRHPGTVDHDDELD